jgi:hypothetical protein
MPSALLKTVLCSTGGGLGVTHVTHASAACLSLIDLKSKTSVQHVQSSALVMLAARQVLNSRNQERIGYMNRL